MTRDAAARAAWRSCARARSSTTHSLRFDSGHTVSGICSRTSRSTSARILVAAHAVIDALDLEQVERLADVRGGAFLAGVRDRAQAEARAPCEHALELRRRVAALAGVEADADEARSRNGSAASSVANASSSERWRRKHRISSDGDAVAALARRPSRRAGRRSRPRSATPRAVWVCGSKNSSAWTTLSACARVEVRHRERVEVAAVAQHVAAGVVEVEERLQVVERVRGAHRLDRGVRQRRRRACRRG